MRQKEPAKARVNFERVVELESSLPELKWYAPNFLGAFYNTTSPVLDVFGTQALQGVGALGLHLLPGRRSRRHDEVAHPDA